MTASHLPATIRVSRRKRPDADMPQVLCIGGPLDGQRIATGERIHRHKAMGVDHVYVARTVGTTWLYALEGTPDDVINRRISA